LAFLFFPKHDSTPHRILGVTAGLLGLSLGQSFIGKVQLELEVHEAFGFFGLSRAGGGADVGLAVGASVGGPVGGMVGAAVEAPKIFTPARRNHASRVHLLFAGF